MRGILDLSGWLWSARNKPKNRQGVSQELQFVELDESGRTHMDSYRPDVSSEPLQLPEQERNAPLLDEESFQRERRASEDIRDHEYRSVAF